MSDVTDRLAALEAAVYANKLPDTVAILQRKLEASWQPDASVLLQPGSITPALLPERTVRGGFVGSTGVVNSGTGDFTVTRNAAGDYSVTFSPAFSDTPAVVAMPSVAANVFVKYFSTSGPTSTGFRLAVLSTAGTLTDADVYFIAAGRR